MFFINKYFLCLLIVLATPLVGRAQTVLISEFLASNDGGLADESGSFEDWIELYNQGDTAVNLGGWHLTDDAENLARWRFPAVTIPPGGYLLVFASGKDLREAGANLHTNFKLGASGEEIGLYASDGTTPIDTLSFGEQQTDICYGRFPDGSNTWKFLDTATPGASNN